MHVCNMIICCFEGLRELDQKERWGGYAACVGNDKPSAVFCRICSGLYHFFTLDNTDYILILLLLLLYYLKVPPRHVLDIWKYSALKNNLCPIQFSTNILKMLSTPYALWKKIYNQWICTQDLLLHWKSLLSIQYVCWKLQVSTSLLCKLHNELWLAPNSIRLKHWRVELRFKVIACRETFHLRWMNLKTAHTLFTVK